MLTKQETIEAIVKEAKKLDKLDLQILLAQLRVKKMQKDGVKPAADYDSSKTKPPAMHQVDKWKHQSRKQHADK